MYRCDKGRGGGVCIYIRDVFTVAPLEIDIARAQGVEDVWVTVQSSKFPSVIIGCPYRHPKARCESYDYITDVIRYVSLKDKPFYILGHFNDNVLCENSKMPQIIFNTKLTQVISKPTRITPTSATLIDLIVTNKTQSILHTDTMPCPVGDHEFISVTVNLKKTKRPPIVKTFRDLTSYSSETICDLLTKEIQALNNIFTTDNVDSQVNIFTSIFNNCLNKYAPLVTKEVRRPFAPWINEHLRSLMHERDEAQINLKNDRSNVNLQSTYKELIKRSEKVNKKNLSQSITATSLRAIYRGNSVATWKILNQVISKDKRKAPLEIDKDEGKLKKKVESFNNFFANVGKITFEK